MNVHEVFKISLIRINIQKALMNWNQAIKGFTSFLKLERSLSPNTLEAYQHDVNKLQQYPAGSGNKLPAQITT